MVYLEHVKLALISRKICMSEKFLNFYTVYNSRLFSYMRISSPDPVIRTEWSHSGHRSMCLVYKCEPSKSEETQAEKSKNHDKHAKNKKKCRKNQKSVKKK